MSSIGTGYDLSASQFSPDGRVFQIEYAAKAAEISGTAIGLRGKDGCILAVEKVITSKLHEPDSGRRIFTIENTIGLVICGLITDGRAIVNYALKEAQNYRRQYGRTIPLKILNERLSSLFHAYTLYSAVRPYGVCVILTTWTEENGAEMYCIEPSGVSFGYFGCATGKAKQAAKTEIEKLKLENLSTRELLNEGAKIIYRVNEDSTDSDTKFKLELSWVGKDTNGIHQICPANLYEEAKASASAAMEQGDSEGD